MFKNKEKYPVILFLQPQPCVRALKYAQGLRYMMSNRIRLFFGYLYHKLSRLYGYGDELFDDYIRLSPRNILYELRKLTNKVKPTIIHSHNAPDFLTVAAIEVAGSIPVIHDVHDPLSLRKTRYYADNKEEGILCSEHERIANEKSNGRIYVTEGVKDYIQAKYFVKAKNDLVYQNYVSGSLIPIQLNRKLSAMDGEIHIAYAGSLTSMIKDSHYNLEKIFLEIAKQNMHIHIYVPREDIAYRKLAESNKYVHYHGQLNRKHLLQELTQYDFGWAGFNHSKNGAHLDVAFPNKVLEYLAAGLPVLAYPHRTLKSFIEGHKVGIIFNTIVELKKKLAYSRKELERVRLNVLRKRKSFTVEDHAYQLVNYYNFILESIGKSNANMTL
jgi:glycosyltransferase involved in cell wall biosynthesis